MHTTQSAGGVVLNDEGQIIVVSQRGTSWSLPKGHIDAGENALQAAQREIYEETGIRDLKLLKDLGEYQRYRIGKDKQDDTTELKTIHMFLFKTTERTLAPLDPLNPEARWVLPADAVALLTHPKDKEFLQRVTPQL